MRYVAFLRAINVGGRVVRMDDLRRLCSSIGLANVETFIASGNVIFDSTARNAARIEASIEQALEKALGYPVTTFIRANPELAALAEHPLVSGEQVPAGASLYVGFLREAPAKAAARALLAFNNDVDTFAIHERHVLWMVHGKFLESTFSGARLEKVLAMPATLRNATTIRKLAARHGSRNSPRPARMRPGDPR